METPQQLLIRKLPEIKEFIEKCIRYNGSPCECTYIYAVFPSIEGVDPTALKCLLMDAGFIIESYSHISPYGWQVV